MIVAGTQIRRTCYRYLGRHFTFTPSLQEDHRLITTGPYSVVRHPSYSGGLLVAIGLLLSRLGAGSWLWEARFTAGPLGKAAVGLWFLHTLGAAFIALERIPKEDEMLRKEFGAEWDVWARQTPYRYIPWIY